MHAPICRPLLAFIVSLTFLVTGCQHRFPGKPIPDAPLPQSARFADYDTQIKHLLAQMTLDEKIGQMLQADQEHIKDRSDIAKYHMGSVLCGGSSDPKAGNSPAAWRAMIADCQAAARSTRLRIPLLFGIDAVHGNNNVLGAVIYPHNIGLGHIPPAQAPALVESIAHATAEETRAIGANWAFAPCIAVPRDPRWGRTYEGFSSDPAIVSQLGAASIRGLQGPQLGAPGGVLACAKHFLGDGGTTFNSALLKQKGKAPLDQGDTRCDEATLRSVHLPPYRAAIATGVGSIMVSYSSWNGQKCTGSKYLLTDLLKTELNFQGFVISDYNAIDQVNPDYKQAIKQCINAGIDMAMVPKRYAEFFDDLKSLVESGDVPMSRIDDAVTRILRIKCAMGLLEGWNGAQTVTQTMAPDPTAIASFGSPAHRRLAAQAAAASVTRIKSSGKLLDLTQPITVAGAAADNLGRQCGGWTIDWQGGEGSITSGTTLLQALRRRAPDPNRITYAPTGDNIPADTKAIVAVIAEKPYAEGRGDVANLALDPNDIALIQKLHATGKPLTVLIYSGRPLDTTPIQPLCDTLLNAWLPGSEGEGLVQFLITPYDLKDL